MIFIFQFREERLFSIIMIILKIQVVSTRSTEDACKVN